MLINFLVLLLSALQINWAVHEGLSGSDMGLSPWLHTEMLCLYPLIVTNMLLLIFKKRKSGYLTQATILSTTVCIYWLLVNYLNFSVYVTSWSTFSVSETWMHVGLRSLLPVVSCGLLLFVSVCFSLRRSFNFIATLP